MGKIEGTDSWAVLIAGTVPAGADKNQWVAALGQHVTMTLTLMATIKQVGVTAVRTPLLERAIQQWNLAIGQEQQRS